MKRISRKPVRGTLEADRERKGSMPYFKCLFCRIRLSRFEVSIGPPEGSCPLCGRPLEQPGELASLMGLRILGSREGKTRTMRTMRAGGGDDGRKVARIHGPVATADPVEPQDAGGWIDDGGSAKPEALLPWLPRLR
jgi:hypothetical protein